MKISEKKRKKFQEFMFTWWIHNKRDLPWRHTHDSYKIMISEVMLQQTQVERVLLRYAGFISAYPTVTSLSKASIGAVLRLWKGMGYNRRALYLKQASDAILRAHKGVFPDSEDALMKLPGIGRYTARVILVFSFKKDIAMVDTNIRKIITHFFFADQKQPEKAIQEVADQIVPKGKSWEWHQALMDFGAASQFKIKDQRLKIMKKENTISFHQSTRFFRGRLMDLVRERTWNQKDLIKEMEKKYGKEVLFYEKIIEKLVQEGLLAHLPLSIISLPE